jgi:hypothetical protein
MLPLLLLLLFLLPALKSVELADAERTDRDGKGFKLSNGRTAGESGKCEFSVGVVVVVLVEDSKSGGEVFESLLREWDGGGSGLVPPTPFPLIFFSTHNRE